MTGKREPPRLRAALGCLAAALACASCTDGGRVAAGAGAAARGISPLPAPRPPAVYQAEVEEGIGAAVMVLLDTSGSMAGVAKGDHETKDRVARRAIEKMLDATDKFVADRPDFPVKIGLLHFSSDAWHLLKVQPYDRKAVQAALARVPGPGGGTAIGAALERARAELYRSGCYRKYILAVTDGENTAGPAPDRVAREIHRKSEGAVVIYFIAFDMSAASFGFLKEVGGDAVPARNAVELERSLKEIYEGKILAEAVSYGE